MQYARFIALISASLTTNAASITGPANLTDGDTIEILGVPIRLEGIDAPETGQDCKRPGGGQYDCGKHSLDHLRTLIAGQEVVCEGNERDRYGRLLATCYVGDLNINEAMVRTGWAVAFLQYSDTYEYQENLAKNSKAGIWNGEFVRPYQFRAGEWEGARGSAEVASENQCTIEGYINSKGVKIYHTPWSRSYKKTKINTAKGERWFCTEKEALAAGWRAPRR